MSTKSYTYEQPLNERVRTFLRVETLMRRFHYFTALKGDWSGYSALLGILEVTALLERGDLKQELLKELERQYGALKLLATKDGVDKAKLDLILSKQNNAIDQIHKLNGKLGEPIKRIDFLLAIKQRTSIPGGSCNFDLPQLRYWLNQTHEQRMNDLSRWAAPYVEIESVIELILYVIRDSGTPKQVVADKGFFQQSLDSQRSNQLLRIEIPANKAYYPEISAGKHRYSVRFLTSQSIDQVPSQVTEDVPFLLSRCSL
ncbi:MAG: cell division protein ZapD [Gammaproteobacteria bacterium]|nr:MAG: cell division protein ZapD [Gammaproteobacteria bacterium]